jgi:hypothetical protein
MNAAYPIAAFADLTLDRMILKEAAQGYFLPF